MNKKPTNDSQTIEDMRKSIKKSFIGRNKVRLLSQATRAKRITQSYRLPILVTVAFVVSIALLVSYRQLQRTSILALVDNATNGENYSTLLSVDQEDEFERNDITEPNQEDDNANGGDSTQNTSTPFSVSTENSPNNSSTGTTNNTTGNIGGSANNGDDNNSGENPTDDPPTDDPVLPFGALIASFSRQSTVLDCKNPSKPKVGSCSKIYSFEGSILTENGPGAVIYSWQSSQGGSNGSFSVATGSSITSVSRDISIRCNLPTNFTIQLTVTSPNISNSNVLSINHDCNEL